MQKTANTVAHVSQFLSALAEETGDHTMTSQQLQLLLSCYTYGQLVQHDLHKYTGVARSANSRNIAKMGIGEAPWAKPGPGWIESFEDPKDRRTKMVRLTPKGIALLRTVVDKCSGK